MNTQTNQWDIKCPEDLQRLFPVRRGYYYRIGHDKARMILDILSNAYGIEKPNLEMIRKRISENAMYDYETQTVYLYSMSHIKSVFHEFYHHLDKMTNGLYDSDDKEGGASSLAWMYSEKMWEFFRQLKN